MGGQRCPACCVEKRCFPTAAHLQDVGRRVRPGPEQNLHPVVEQQDSPRGSLVPREGEGAREADAAAGRRPSRRVVEVREAVECWVREPAQRSEGHGEHAVYERRTLVGGDAGLPRGRGAAVEDGLLEAEAEQREGLPVGGEGGLDVLPDPPSTLPTPHAPAGTLAAGSQGRRAARGPRRRARPLREGRLAASASCLRGPPRRPHRRSPPCTRAGCRRAPCAGTCARGGGRRAARCRARPWRACLRLRRR